MTPGLISRLLGEGNERVHAAVILMTAVTLCSVVIGLAIASALEAPVVTQFSVAVAALSGLAGWAYGKAKQVGVAAPSATGAPGSDGGTNA